MKILILSCNTGQGHNSAANAVCEAALKYGAEAKVVDALAFLGKRTSELFCKNFVGAVVGAPQAFGLVCRVAGFISNDKLKSPVYAANILYAEQLLDYIRENGYDVCICSHLFPAETLTYLKKHNGLDVPCYIIGTDYSCIPFWEELDMDGWFVPDAEMADECVERGIPREKLIITGIPVAGKFRRHEAADMKAARAHVGIPDGVRAFLIMSGGDGGGNAVGVTENLLKYGGDGVRAVVLTGRSEELKAKIAEKFGGDERVLSVEFTTEIETYMDACDVLMTKAGGLTSTEVAVRGKPMIHVSPIPGVEDKNALFFAVRGMSILAEDAESAARYALFLAEDERRIAAMSEAQEKFMKPDAADEIIRAVTAGAAVKAVK